MSAARTAIEVLPTGPWYDTHGSALCSKDAAQHCGSWSPSPALS